MISFLLYDPQFLQTLCGIISSPHLLHFTNAGAVIFQFALLLSLLDFEDLFFGQIDITFHLLAFSFTTLLQLYLTFGDLSTYFQTFFIVLVTVQP